MSKKIIEHFCINCHSEFMITWDNSDNLGKPEYCPFCSEKVEEDIMYYEDDDFEDYAS